MGLSVSVESLFCHTLQFPDPEQSVNLIVLDYSKEHNEMLKREFLICDDRFKWLADCLESKYQHIYIF